MHGTNPVDQSMDVSALRLDASRRGTRRSEVEQLQVGYWLPVRPSRWRWRPWPMLIPFTLVVACVALPFVDAVLPDFTPGPTDLPQSVRDHAALLWVLCWLPAIRYTLASTRARRPIPFLPIIGILYGLYYALSTALGYSNYWGRDPLEGSSATALFDPRFDYGHAVDMALIGWILCLLGRWALIKVWRPPLPRIGRRLASLQPRVLATWAFAVAWVGILFAVANRVMPFAEANVAMLRMLSFLEHTAIIVLIVCMRCDLLSRRERIATWGVVAATVYIDFGAGATAEVLYTAFAVFIALWIGRHGFPLRYLALGAAVIALCVSIRGVMHEWRTEIWWSGREVSGLEGSRVLVRLLAESAQRNGASSTITHGWGVIARRSSNIELLADVMRRTPADIPYWNGYSYASLVGAFVPRVLWPGKPTKTMGQDFGHRYAYLAPGDRSTSINLPVLIEFYINFGDMGVAIGMLLVGVIYGALEQLCNRAGQSWLVTAAAAPLLTQLFVVESDLSLQYGGLLLQLATMFAAAAAVVRFHAPRQQPWYVIPWPTVQIPSMR